MMSITCSRCKCLQKYFPLKTLFASHWRCISGETSYNPTNKDRCSSDVVEKAKVKLGRIRVRRKPTTKDTSQKLSNQSKENAVPASKVSRMINYGGLAAGLGLGVITDTIKTQLGVTPEKRIGDSAFLTESNVERIVATLCKVRGAALKLCQMLSMQDNSLIPQQLQQLFDRVRANADFMPQWQMEKMLTKELGANWRALFKEFDMKPFAAASIGQVHRGLTHDDIPIAVKIQYPGVAESINSDIDTLLSILTVSKILPEGLFLEQTADVARRELAWEVDYLREAECIARFKKLLEDDDDYFVADSIPELTTKRILTTELIQGVPLDQVEILDQATRNKVSKRILKLCLSEVFKFNFMQTDPNWSNFFYNQETDQICLLDFGASREYSKRFVDTYIKVIYAAASGDRIVVEEGLSKLGFQTGYESKALIKANVDAVMTLGKPFAADKEFDFSGQDITEKIHHLIPVMLRHRLTPPPEESYSLHRKMAGTFLVCIKLRAKFNCYDLLQENWNSYNFS